MAVVKSEQPFADPMLFNLVFGHKGGMQPTPEMLAAFRSFVPSDALWGVTHFGRDNWTFLAAAIAMGATPELPHLSVSESHQNTQTYKKCQV